MNEEITIYGLLNIMANELETMLLEDKENNLINDFAVNINYDDLRIEGFVQKKSVANFIINTNVVVREDYE